MPPARGRAACNICRSRKQKCDGIRPACSRCRSFGSQCTWPTVLKRGPPKGYTKALETRLRETELVLIRLLHSTNDKDLLARAFNDDAQDLFNGQITEHNSSGIGEQKMLALMDHWERFPLRTADNVEQWIEQVTKNSVVQDRVENQPNEEMPELSQAVKPSDNINHQPEADIQSHVGTGDDLSVESPCHGHAVDQDPIFQAPMEIASVAIIQAPEPADLANKLQNITTSHGIELPADFKQQFLW
ncbi:Regulatory protein CAT8 [Fusarium oxysporum f. sp. cubense]|uniref:Regulatory protein CAT8 n=1 Tax=Fusarium oxysporum f. sp. cubense TaxID=61366 RepID=A0A559LPM2_FUSOC|nr:Regulatory protein CAT8 [Fusarium oxysporum f. sp. cubense]